MLLYIFKHTQSENTHCYRYISTLHVYTMFAPRFFSFILVVDVYQSYGGPCKALEAKFRAIKNTLGDPLLAFAIVSSHQLARFCL